MWTILALICGVVQGVSARVALVRSAGHAVHDRLYLDNVFERVTSRTGLTFAPGTSFERCAIVGGGDVLAGAGRGAEIDAHDFVVRVNRIPTEPFFEDFGKKTSVLFSLAQGYVHGKGRIAVMAKGSDKATHVAKCNDPRDQLSPLCKFDALMLWAFSFNTTSHGTTGKSKSLRDILGVWNETDIPIGFPALEVRESAQYMLTANGLEEGHQPTSGFMAVATFAPVCGELTLYGFASKGKGDQSADGHPVGTRHDYTLEHSVMNRIMSGEMHADVKWKTKVLPDKLKWIEEHYTNAGATAIRSVTF